MQTCKRFLEASKNSFFLFGPRGSGKTIWLREQVASPLFFIDLLDENILCIYEAHPSLLREQLLAERKLQADKSFVVIIDEIQKLPALLDVVHRLIVDTSSFQFILTGSSARKIKRQNVNLLGGRASLRHMHPFMASEMGAYFDLKKTLQLGFLPVVWDAKAPEDTLKGYVSIYLQQEVKHEGFVRNVGTFSRFLEIASFSHGSVPNMNAIARECGVSAVSVKNYFDILEDLLLCFWVPVFSKRAKRILVSKPKFYYFDTGVYQSLRPKGILDVSVKDEGAALEGMIGQHLRAWCEYSEGEHKLYYWRTKSGVEVDFIVYGEKEFCAFEVKNTTRVRSEDLRHLQLFREDYPEAKLYFLYRGSETRQLPNGIFCLPCERFLVECRPNKML